MLRKLSEIRAQEDPLKQSQIEFIIKDTPGLLLAKLAQKLFGQISGDTATASALDLRLRCTSYSFPGTKIGQTDLNIAGFRRKLGTTQNKSGTWKIKVVEDYHGSVMNIISGWMDIIHSNVLGTRVPSVAYVSTAELIVGGNVNYPNTNKEIRGRTITLHGVYPIAMSVGDVNPSSSDAVEVNIDFNVDFYAERGLSLFNLIG